MWLLYLNLNVIHSVTILRCSIRLMLSQLNPKQPNILRIFDLQQKIDQVLTILKPSYNKAVRLASRTFANSPTAAVYCEWDPLPFEHLALLKESHTALRMTKLVRTSVLMQRAKISYESITVQNFP